jgi:hypothetical protein
MKGFTSVSERTLSRRVRAEVHTLRLPRHNLWRVSDRGAGRATVR